MFAAFIGADPASAMRSIARPPRARGAARPERVFSNPDMRAAVKELFIKKTVARPHKEEFRSALREQSEMKFLRATVFPARGCS